MIDGKATEETATCLQHSFQKTSISAERAIVNCDGAILTYDLLKFVACSVIVKIRKEALNQNTYHQREIIAV